MQQKSVYRMRIKKKMEERARAPSHSFVTSIVSKPIPLMGAWTLSDRGRLIISSMFNDCLKSIRKSSTIGRSEYDKDSNINKIKDLQFAKKVNISSASSKHILIDQWLFFTEPFLTHYLTVKLNL